jgi:hypothetical protein
MIKPSVSSPQARIYQILFDNNTEIVKASSPASAARRAFKFKKVTPSINVEVKQLSPGKYQYKPFTYKVSRRKLPKPIIVTKNSKDIVYEYSTIVKAI